MWFRGFSVKADRLTMKLCSQSLGQLAFFSFCCALLTVRQSESTFVPGRCLCPDTQPGVRGQLTEIQVYPKSPSCNKITIIVTMKVNSVPVCLSPEAPLGKQLIKCWNRSHKLGRDVKLCLKRRRRGRGRGGKRQRARQRSRKTSSAANTQ